MRHIWVDDKGEAHRSVRIARTERFSAKIKEVAGAPRTNDFATIGKKLSTLSGDQLGKMGYFCQDRFPQTISSKLGRCVLHGGVKTTVGEKGGSSRLVEELERFER